VVKLAAAEVNNTVDAGLYKAAAIGDRVWLDSNKNGLQDCDECGVAGVKVILLDADGKQVGNAVTTDCDGNYMFSNLKPGVYTVAVRQELSAGRHDLHQGQSGTSDSVDSDVDANGPVAQRDAGFRSDRQIDRCWCAGCRHHRRQGLDR
jgi:hypothetical protein